MYIYSHVTRSIANIQCIHAMFANVYIRTFQFYKINTLLWLHIYHYLNKLVDSSGESSISLLACLLAELRNSHVNSFSSCCCCIWCGGTWRSAMAQTRSTYTVVFHVHTRFLRVHYRRNRIDIGLIEENAAKLLISWFHIYTHTYICILIQCKLQHN